MAIISAWAVGSLSVSRWLCPRPMMRSSCTTTAPIGTSSSSKAKPASAIAARMNASSDFTEEFQSPLEFRAVHRPVHPHQPRDLGPQSLRNKQCERQPFIVRSWMVNRIRQRPVYGQRTARPNRTRLTGRRVAEGNDQVQARVCEFAPTLRRLVRQGDIQATHRVDRERVYEP